MTTRERFSIFFSNPNLFWNNTVMKCSKFIKSDRIYLKLRWKFSMNYPLNLDNPKSFNEKLQWYKLYDRNPLYTIMVDKYLAKEYVAKIIGSQYIIPTIGVWDNANDIDFDKLPERFVLKCNHDSGTGMCICKDKSALDINSVRMELNKGLKEDYYSFNREWSYKNVKRRIIAEQYMEDGNSKELTDFKIHCFNGVPRAILVCRDRFSDTGLTEDFYDVNWNLMEVRRPSIPNSIKPMEKPFLLEEMLELAKMLSNGIPFLRVDFYIVNQCIYFGELTFYPASGFTSFEPEKWDYIFGSWITLPSKH